MCLTACLLLSLTQPVVSNNPPPPALAHPVIVAQTPVRQPASARQTQPLTFYQPLQTIAWDGTRFSPNGVAYFGQEDVSQVTAIESDLEAARALKDRAKEARILANLGLLAYFGENFQQAIDYYKASLTVAREGNDREIEEIALGNLGLIQVQKGFYNADTVELLHDFLGFARTKVDKQRRLEQIALGNLANAYFGADLYVQAIDLHQQRLKIARQVGDRASEAKALGDLGLVYAALGQLPKAIQYQQQQLTIAGQIGDRRNQNLALASLGSAYQSLGDYQQAAGYQQQRLTLAQQTKNFRAQMEALANLAGTAYFQGDYQRAIDLYEQSWRIGWKYLRDAGVRGNQALAYFQQGNYEKALEYYQQHFTYISARNDRRGQGMVKNNAAVLRWQSGNLAAARKAMEEGIEFWEALRERLGSNDAYRVSIFDTQTALYQNLQALLIAQNQPEAALEVAERGRARAFVDLLARRLGLREKRPTLAPVAPPTIAQIRQIARQRGATLVTYTILSQTFKGPQGLETRESQLFIWVVKPTGEVGFRAVDLQPLMVQNQSLADLVSSSREAIGVRSRGLGLIARQDTRSRSAPLPLRQLYQLLIEPIAAQLPTNPDQPVIFIPQGALFLVPFAALQDGNGRYLIEQHTVTVAPSIQVLELTQKQKRPGRFLTNPLIVGNPVMPKVTVTLGEPAEPLASLPGAEQESRAIGVLLQAQPLIGQAATKAAVVQAMPQAGLIHLATHGLLDDFRGMGVPGAIALAPTAKDDGILTASEILNLKLQADLVVLSACDTGRGQITGDGVIGLSRSLISAGAPTVVVSLWAIPDAPTARLMQQFYQELQKQPHKARALRQAMLLTRQQYPDPRDWAAFILIGEPD